MKDSLTEDEIRQIVTDEICKKLKITVINTGFESQGIRVTVEYDGWTLACEDV